MPEVPKPVRPWDLFLTKERVVDEIKEKRLAICGSGCPNFIKLTKQCIKCGCFLNAKTTLPSASCPIGLWGPTTEHEEYLLPTSPKPTSFYHLHIPKTAGHYLRSHLTFDIEQSLKTNNIPFVVDHGGWKPASNSMFILSSLRDPAERTISHFSHLIKLTSYTPNVKIKDVNNPNVEELFNWINANQSYISNYQAKNFVYSRIESIDSGNFFLNDSSFVNLNINKATVLERISRVNILLKDSQMNTDTLNRVRTSILDSFKVDLTPSNNKEVNENINSTSKKLYEQLTASQKNYLYELNYLDTELYHTESIYWRPS